MLIAKIIGGLGNQLFQYAFAYSLAQQLQTTLLLDTSNYTDFPDRQFDLAHFGIGSFSTSAQLNRFFPTSRFQNWKNHFLQIFDHQQFKIFREPFFHYNPQISQLDRAINWYLEGYWQSPLYFEAYASELRSIFQFRHQWQGKNALFQTQITHSQSVALHIRRGDYVQNPQVSQLYYQCPLAYYQAAIDLIRQKIPNPHFFIFSDDIIWCKQNIKLSDYHTFIDQTNTNLEDMHLMSLCQHQIIANSSFSWWGAWLNPNPDKMVIYPPRWFTDQSIRTTDLFPPNWIRLEI